MKALLTVLFLIPTASLADCAGSETLFSCTFKNGKKSVALCLGSGRVSYSFGPAGGQPELALSHDLTEVGYYPWQGIGRYITETIVIPNSGYSYEINYAIDRNELDVPTWGSLNVYKGADQLAALECDAGSVGASDFYPLYEAREALGLVYCFDGLWGTDCEK